MDTPKMFVNLTRTSLLGTLFPVSHIATAVLPTPTSAPNFSCDIFGSCASRNSLMRFMKSLPFALLYVILIDIERGLRKNFVKSIDKNEKVCYNIVNEIDDSQKAVKGGDTLVNMKFLRERQGLQQEELAQILDVGRSTVAMWETGKSYPRGETLVKLADALRCSIDELYGREPPRQAEA